MSLVCQQNYELRKKKRDELQSLFKATEKANSTVYEGDVRVKRGRREDEAKSSLDSPCAVQQNKKTKPCTPRSRQCRLVTLAPKFNCNSSSTPRASLHGRFAAVVVQDNSDKCDPAQENELLANEILPASRSRILPSFLQKKQPKFGALKKGVELLKDVNTVQVID